MSLGVEISVIRFPTTKKMGSCMSNEFNRKNSLLSTTSNSNQRVLKSSMILDFNISMLRIATLSSQLQFTLSSPTGRALLMEFLTLEKSVENLKFYEEIVAFRRLFLPLRPIKFLDINSKAAFIIEQFVRDESEFQVFLPSQVKESLMRNIKSASHVVDFYKIFDDASQSIFQIILNDSFRRFVVKIKQECKKT